MLKVCTTCLVEKPEEEFHWRYKNIKRTAYCASCQSDRSKKQYQANKTKVKIRSRARVLKQVETINRKIIEFLIKNPCIGCGEKEPLLLDFDHMGNKAHNISSLVRDSLNWSKVEEEIRKCQVLCIVCHRRKTAKDFNFWRYQLQELPEYKQQWQ